MKKATLLLLLSLAFFQSQAQTINWSEDVACIVYTHCSRCHNDQSSLAAIPFITYNEMYNQRNAIRFFTQNKLMPPYLPATHHSNYLVQKNLTAKEIEIIKQWVDGGCIKGDTTKAPSPPSFSIASPTIILPFMYAVALFYLILCQPILL
jgi:hypothetical protein